MADNKIELVIEVDASKGNASIKSFNTGLSSIEQSAAKAARGASSGIDNITVSMVKGAAAGNLLAGAIQKGLDFLYQYTVGAAKYSAHVESMTRVTTGLATAHGEGAEAALKAAKVIQSVGYSTEDAMKAVQGMVVAEMDLGKAKGLAQLAKDAAAASTEGINASEAFEAILRAVESGQGRGLRTMRIYVDLQKEIQYWENIRGRSLTDREKEEVRLNAIERESAGLQGAAALKAQTTEGQMGKLNRTMKDLKESIGKAFQDDFARVVSLLNDMAAALAKNLDLIKALTAAGALGLASGAYKALGALGVPVGAAFSVPGMAVANVVGGAFAIGHDYNQIEASQKRQFGDMQKQQIRSLYWTKGGPEKLRAMGVSDADMKAAVTLYSEGGGEGDEKLWGGLAPKPKPDYDAAERMAEARKRNAEAMRSTEALYTRALEERKGVEAQVARQQLDNSLKIIESTGNETEAAKEAINVIGLAGQERMTSIAKILEEEKREIAALSSYVDKFGQTRKQTPSADVLANVHKATAERVAAFELRFNEEQTRRVEQMWKAVGARSRAAAEEYWIKPFERDIEVWSQVLELQHQYEEQQFAIKRQGVDQRKDMALAQLEGVDAYTVRDKIGLEEKKTTIEIEALKQRTAIELQEIDFRTEYNIAKARQALAAIGIIDDARVKKVTDQIGALGEQDKAALTQSTANQIEVQQLKTAAATRRLVVDQYRSIFDSIKQQAGGVFDALVTKSKSVWQAIGDAMKNAVLNAIKEIVTSRIAMAFMNLIFPDSRGHMASSGMGVWGQIFGAGSTPAFGGGGSPAGAGGAGRFLPGFSMSGFKGMFGIGSNGSSIQLGPGVATSWEAATFGQKAQAVGKSPAAGAAGMGLLAYGMSAGKSVSGDMSLMGGGALTGLQYGGPLGAGIGAATGSTIAGLRRGGWVGFAETGFGPEFGIAILAGSSKLFEKAQTKVREKVKTLYGVDISDMKILTQIVNSAKSGFGGNLDMAIRSPQTKDLIQLYGMNTGQATKGMQPAMQPLELVQSGGALYQGTNYSNGAALPGQGGLPSFDSIGAGVASGGSGVVIQLDGPATTSLLRGEAVQAIVKNPRVVQSAVMDATRSNSGRRQLTSLQLSPGLLTA